MADVPHLQQVLWAANLVVLVSLLSLLLVRKNYRTYPAFFTYILVVLAQNAVGIAVYRRWGYSSQVSWRVTWASQGVVVCARAMAVMELCRHFLGRFRGIWALACRILLACAALVLIYSLSAANHHWALAVLNASRGLELAIAAVVVILFLFARYYAVVSSPAVRSLAAGFCLYSCFSVLNTTIYERLLDRYVPLWNLLGLLAFLASLLIWVWALQKRQPLAVFGPTLLPGEVYRTLAPEVNHQLRLLNDQLSQFWHVEAPRP